MKAKYFINKHMPKYCAVVWVMHTTYFTPPITLKREFFDTRAERDNYLISHSVWWEKLPFIDRYFYVGSKGCD